jgi:hypothetical protein
MIKERTRQFGNLVSGMIKLSLKKKIVQRVGILTLGIAALLGVTQASALRRIMSGAVRSEAAAPVLQVTQKTVAAKPVAANPSIETNAAPSADERLNTTNIVDLIGDSEIIVRGLVKEVTDGFENGVPYTQVTLQVNEALRGQVGEEYTFRQFGLTKPRKLENGKTYLGITPEGWSKYSVGEDAMLFLYKQASITKLRTTTGLGQGKMLFQGGNAVSQDGNEGLFENVDVDARLLNDKDKRLLATKKGAVNAEGFMSFVRRAVKDKWIEGGKMNHAKK